MRERVIGLDIGGTTMQAILCGPELNIVDRLACSTPAREGGGAMAAAAVRMVRSLAGRNSGVLTAVGVGAAGVIEHQSGTVIAASNSFVGWAGTPLASELTRELGVPVTVENDVNAFLAGEIAAGAARDEPFVLGITLGTGVGGALSFAGSLLHGAHGAAGEIGHIPGFGDEICTCGQRGHLETLASGRSVSRLYGRLTGRSLTARGIADAARSGDVHARNVFTDAGRAVGRGILMTAGLVDISAAVIGGGVAQSWDLLAPAIDEALAAEPPVSGHAISIRHSGLGQDAVAVGACAGAFAVVSTRPVSHSGSQ